MLAFALALFPVTGVFGAGQFVHDGGFQSWFGWAQLVTLIAQGVVLYLLRQAIIAQTDLVDADDVLSNSSTQPLFAIALALLLLGLGQYLTGIWRTLPAPTA